MTHPNLESMTLDAFEQLLDTYGPLERWPAQHRANGAAFAEQSASAREMLVQVNVLDSALQELPGLAPSPVLQRTVAQVPVRAPRALTPAFDLRFLWRPLATVGLCAVMGVSMGLVATEAEVDVKMVSDYDEEWEDGFALTQLAFASEWAGDEDDE